MRKKQNLFMAIRESPKKHPLNLRHETPHSLPHSLPKNPASAPESASLPDATQTGRYLHCQCHLRHRQTTLPTTTCKIDVTLSATFDAMKVKIKGRIKAHFRATKRSPLSCCISATYRKTRTLQGNFQSHIRSSFSHTSGTLYYPY